MMMSAEMQERIKDDDEQETEERRGVVDGSVWWWEYVCACGCGCGCVRRLGGGERRAVDGRCG